MQASRNEDLKANFFLFHTAGSLFFVLLKAKTATCLFTIDSFYFAYLALVLHVSSTYRNYLGGPLIKC